MNQPRFYYYFISAMSLISITSITSTQLFAADNIAYEQVDIIYIDEINTIKQRLLAWKDSWSLGDSNKYLNFYIDDYAPLGITHSDWKKNRKQRVTKEKQINITLLIEDILVNGEVDKAQIIFWQDYQSTTYHDKIKKKILWVKINGLWLINSEITINE